MPVVFSACVCVCVFPQPERSSVRAETGAVPLLFPQGWHTVGLNIILKLERGGGEERHFRALCGLTAGNRET